MAKKNHEVEVFEYDDPARRALLHMPPKPRKVSVKDKVHRHCDNLAYFLAGISLGLIIAMVIYGLV